MRPSPGPTRVFVVYGRNAAFRKAMFDFLRAIGLQTMEWGQVLRSAQNASPVIGEALTKAFAKPKATVVLLSGDDPARLGKSFLKPTDGNELAPKARQNVVCEAGMAFSPVDPVTYAAVAIGLASAAALASYVPSRRAAAVEPVEALRTE